MARCGLALFCMCMATAATACDGLQASQAWLREPPPGSTVLAAYFALTNTGSHAIAITGAGSPDFAQAMLHSTAVVDGQMQMRPLASFDLAPGARFAAAPGGAHLMLSEPNRPITTTTPVTISIECSDGQALTFAAPMRRDAPTIITP